MKVVRNWLWVIKQIFSYAPWEGALVLFDGVLVALFPAMKIYLTQQLVDSAVSLGKRQDTLGNVIWSGTLLVLVLILWITLQRLDAWLFTIKIRRKLHMKMAPVIMDRLSMLEYSCFEDSGAQDLFERISREPHVLVQTCFHRIYIVLGTIIVLVSVFFMFFSVSFWMGMGIVLITVPMTLMNYYATYMKNELWKNATSQRRRENDIRSLFSDKHAVYEMKMFGSVDYVGDKWKHYNQITYDAMRKEHLRLGAVYGGGQLLGILYFIFGAVMTTAQLAEGNISLGQMVSVISGLTSVLGKLSTSAWLISNLLQRSMEISYLIDLMHMPLRNAEGFCQKLSNYDIRFDHVSFSYPGSSRTVLKDVSFTIRDGEHVAFVGENGSGKTTMIKLLCGLYPLEQGRILIGGRDISTFSDQMRREMITVVFQDFQSYQMTLRENIGLGNLSCLNDDLRLKEALIQAGAEELLEKSPEGLDMELGKLTESGIDFSKGQWQRVATARAFVSDSRYVILDEPTASLDPIAESRMYENFSKLFRDRGTIMISHRMASARMADRILVIDGGTIAESGSHEQLMEKNGLYARMYSAQASWYREEVRA